VFENNEFVEVKLLKVFSMNKFNKLFSKGTGKITDSNRTDFMNALNHGKEATPNDAQT
jgi:hypothetical protein